MLTIYAYTIILSAVIVTYVAIQLFVVPFFEALIDLVDSLRHPPHFTTTSEKEAEWRRRVEAHNRGKGK